MSYRESEIKCDWCSKFLDSGEDIACRECYEALESENYDLKKEIEDLRNSL